MGRAEHLLAAAFFVSAAAAGPPESVASFEAALATYESAVADWSTLVSEQLDRQRTVARATNDAAALARVEAEAEQFTTRRLVPLSLPAGIRRKLGPLSVPLERASKAAADDLVGAGQLDAAVEVRRRLAEATLLARKTAVRDQLVGRWVMSSGDHRNGFTFRPDGTAHTTAKDLTRPWVIDLDSGYVTVTSENGYQDNLHLPLNPRGTEGHSNRGHEQTYVKVR